MSIATILIQQHLLNYSKNMPNLNKTIRVKSEINTKVCKSIIINLNSSFIFMTI